MSRSKRNSWTVFQSQGPALAPGWYAIRPAYGQLLGPCGTKDGAVMLAFFKTAKLLPKKKRNP